MADQLIIDAKKKIEEFAKIWEEREHEFERKEMWEASNRAQSLSYVAKLRGKDLEELLEEDKILDKQYDKIKGEKEGKEAMA